MRIAHTIRDLRYVRREEFGLALDEPAWDILIELYCRDNVGASTTTAMLEDAASVPPSTGRRWVKHLEQLGYATIKPDPTNPEVGYVEMTETAKSTLERYLTRVLAAAEVPS